MNCKSCLTTIRIGHYCQKCKKELFGGANVQPLGFDKETFYKVRTEMVDRMSISGVQEKISLTLSGNELEPTVTDGRFILKPVPSVEELHNRIDIVANEHLSMQLSKQVFGINTAPSALIPFNDGELAYITRRFDYAVDNTKLDQEDFASVLQYTENSRGKNYKYESSYEEIADAIKHFVPAYRPALEELFLRVVFNYLIANGDAHVKNFSLYRPENREDFTLTPNYDVLYTRYHVNETDGDMALDLFKDTESRSYSALGYYSLEDFELFASMLGIPKKRVQKLFGQIVRTPLKVEEMVDRSFLSDDGKEAYLTNFNARMQDRLLYMIGNDFSYDSMLSKEVEKGLKYFI